MKRLIDAPELRPTLWVKPDQPLQFQYRRRRLLACQGDTIGTALYAGGVRIFSRSLKYHRPRGLYSLDGESANTYVEADGIPNVCAELTPVRHGMRVQPQVHVGSPERDPLGWMKHLSWAMPAGFYYHIFHRPARLWPLAANLIRRAAGHGHLKPDFQLQGVYEELHLNTDVCVLGGGPAGLSAALAAAGTGLRVVLLEGRAMTGGNWAWRPFESDGQPLYAQAAELHRQATECTNLRLFTHTAVSGLYPHNLVTAFERGDAAKGFTERYISVKARAVVVATGCTERPGLFENNDQPGIMFISCAHRLARNYGILPGQSAVLAINDDRGLEVAADLADLGVDIRGVADGRSGIPNAAHLAMLQARNLPYLPQWTVARAHGNGVLQKVTLTDIAGQRQRELNCDCLITSAGLTGRLGPLAMVGASLEYDPQTGLFQPRGLPEDVFPAGEVLGYRTPATITASGRWAGLRAAAHCGADLTAELREAQEVLQARPKPPAPSDRLHLRGRKRHTFICFDEDATLKTVDQALAAGFDIPELIKRYAAVGTGPGQSGISGHNLPLYVHQHQNRALSTLPPPPTTLRPPLTPVLMGTVAGRNHHPVKRTPACHLQQKAGAHMELSGSWHRARYFGTDATAQDEIDAVRTRVGILDASTLGKFRVFGPDAGRILERVYVGNMQQIETDRMKYAAMCNEDGCLVDDGVVVRRGASDYYLTTSSARADMTIQWLRYHSRHESWQYAVVNLTDAFGVINLAGPQAREVLARLTEADLTNTALPYMGYQELTVMEDIPARVMRLGFVGELSYELHVPASAMPALWQALLAAGRDFGIQPFGLEAQNTLRLEKGHVIIGSESEQRTTLHDLGLGFLWYRHKPAPQTVGAVALEQTEHQPGRLKLVGIQMPSGSPRPPRDGSPVVDQKIRGYVCTARYSQTLQAAIGLALVDDELAAPGTTLGIYEDNCRGQLMYANVVRLPFYDPEGHRLRM